MKRVELHTVSLRALRKALRWVDQHYIKLELLGYLAEHRGRIVPYGELLDHLYLGRSDPPIEARHLLRVIILYWRRRGVPIMTKHANGLVLPKRQEAPAELAGALLCQRAAGGGEIEASDELRGTVHLAGEPLGDEAVERGLYARRDGRRGAVVDHVEDEDAFLGTEAG